MILSFLSPLALSQSQSRLALHLDTIQQPVALSDRGEYWIDTQARLEAAQVAAATDVDWKPTRLKGIYPLGPKQALWIKFTVPPVPDKTSWLLEIPYPALDRASLYTRDQAGQWLEQRAGDLTPVNQWSIPHRYPLMLLKFNAEEPTHFLLRIENMHGFSAPVRFINARHELRSEQQVSMFLGVYFGLALLGCIIGLVGMVWLKDSAYLYYTLCSAMVGLTLAAITGVAALQLWPNAPNWADRSLVILAVWMLVSTLLLNATVVSLAERSRTMNALVWLVAGAGVLLSVALGVTDSSIRLHLVIPYVLMVPVLVLVLNLWAWRHGDRFGGWLLLSSVPVVISGVLATLRYLQWLPLSFATDQGGLASLALQLPVLLAVLALRSQHRRENIRRISGLKRIDPTTGLINGHVFYERLMHMINRAERLKRQSAVLLIDIVNADQMQREFGRQVADELPLRVAARLLSTTREIDSTARLSEWRFGMLVEGPCSAEDAAALGPRIVARCLMHYQGMHVNFVARVRVAYTLVPYHGADAGEVLLSLEKRLASASPDDKKAVFVLNEATPLPPYSRFRWK